MCSDTHLMRQRPGRSEAEPEGRQRNAHLWKLQLSPWSASFAHYFLSFYPPFPSLSVYSLLPHFFLHPMILFFHLFTVYSPPVYPEHPVLLPVKPNSASRFLSSFSNLLSPPSLHTCLAYLLTAYIVKHCIYRGLGCSGSPQSWALGRAAPLIFIPAV